MNKLLKLCNKSLVFIFKPDVFISAIIFLGFYLGDSAAQFEYIEYSGVLIIFYAAVTWRYHAWAFPDLLSSIQKSSSETYKHHKDIIETSVEFEESVKDITDELKELTDSLRKEAERHEDKVHKTDLSDIKELKELVQEQATLSQRLAQLAYLDINGGSSELVQSQIRCLLMNTQQYEKLNQVKERYRKALAEKEQIILLIGTFFWGFGSLIQDNWEDWLRWAASIIVHQIN